jgi:magnesium transporter
VVETLGTGQMAGVFNEMAPDDRTRLFEELPAEVTKRALSTLSPEQLKIARNLLGYPEGSAGRFMTPKYLAVRPDWTAREALEYIREHGQGIETLNVIYVTDDKGVLLDDLRLPILVLAKPEKKVSELNDASLVSIPATATRDEVVATFEKYDRIALPVTDSRGVLVGMITVDDVLDVAEQKATEEIHGLGGVEALEAPYFDVSMGSMVKKRGGWLSALFLGEMLTATAMSAFEDEIAKAVVSRCSSADHLLRRNSGSQATVDHHPLTRAAGGEAAGLVAGGEPRGGVRRRAGVPAGVHRPPSHRHLGEGVPPLRGALPPGGDHGGAEPDRRGALRETWWARCCRSCSAGWGSIRRRRRPRSSRRSST